MSFRALTILALLATAAPAGAADPLTPRVDRIEKELKAVQRKVFPGGAPAFSEPEIAPATGDTAPAGTPAAQPLRELSTRVDGLEREVTRLTRQLEEDEHRLDVLSQATARDRADFDARLKAIEAARAAPPVAAADAPAPPPARRGTRPAPAAETAVDPVEPAAVEPVATASGDPAEDAYMAGYRLWEQKKYPEAQAALTKVVKQYPKHKRASYARNLLGRAQLDAGTPAIAAQTFYGNYQADPRGERAPDSLFYLGQALTQLKKPAEACRAYGELEQVYGSTLSAALKDRLPAAKKTAACK